MSFELLVFATCQNTPGVKSAIKLQYVMLNLFQHLPIWNRFRYPDWPNGQEIKNEGIPSLKKDGILISTISGTYNSDYFDYWI